MAFTYIVYDTRSPILSHLGKIEVEVLNGLLQR